MISAVFRAVSGFRAAQSPANKAVAHKKNSARFRTPTRLFKEKASRYFYSAGGYG